MKPDGVGGSSEVMWPVAYDIGKRVHILNNPGWSENLTNYVDWALGRNGESHQHPHGADGSSSYWDIDTKQFLYLCLWIFGWYNLVDYGLLRQPYMPPTGILRTFEPDLDNWTGGTGDPHIKPFFGGPYNL